jgi:hypothetical protein
MDPSEFKRWIENCIQEAESQGLSEELVLYELIEQVKFKLVEQQIKTMCHPP